MPLLTTLPIALITLGFLLLPFVGADRFFSVRVDMVWRGSREARFVRRTYEAVVLLVGLLTSVAAVYARPNSTFFVLGPLLQICAVLAVWRWAWSRTAQHRIHVSVQRSATLRPNGVQASSLLSLAACLPILLTGLILHARYAQIPASFPVHFTAEGVADHIASRNLVSVFGQLILATIVILFLAGLRKLIQERGAGVPDQGRYANLTGWYIAGVCWFVSLVASATSLLPLFVESGGYPRRLGSFVGAVCCIFLLSTLGFVAGNRRTLVAAQDATKASGWKGGIIYYDREDSALFVPKRLGFGWTLNMAQPLAWIIMGVTLTIALLPTALKHL